MGIYIDNGHEISEYEKIRNFKEEYIEEFLHKHITVLDPDIFIIGHQVSTNKKKRIDLMGMDHQGNTVIVETKRGKVPRTTLAQIIEYVSWVRSIEYNDLNGIINKYSKGEYDLSKKFAHNHKKMPREFNKKTRLYIVSTQIDDSLIQQINEIKHSAEIKCIEINFYKNKKQRLAYTQYVYGNRKNAIGEKTQNRKSRKRDWNEILENSDLKIKKEILEFIQQINKKYKCSGEIQGEWYYFNIKNQKHFAAIIPRKRKKAILYFKCDPNTFNTKEQALLPYKKAWFFRPYERKIRLDLTNRTAIFKCLDHAHSIVENS